jgi:hypothetical protein
VECAKPASAAHKLLEPVEKSDSVMLIPQSREKHPGSFSYFVEPKETVKILLPRLRDQDDRD